MSILQSVVNTNISSVTDFNGTRGNFPQGVMAFECGPAVSGAGGNTAAVADTVLIAGAETVGAYQGTLPVGVAAAAGVVQLITMTFATAHGWSSKTHDIDISLVGAAAEARALTVGDASGSFGTETTVEIRREAGAVAGAGGDAQLQAATMLVQIRERGVEQPNA